jgi:hypothetical protein
VWIVDHVAPVRVRGPRTRGARARMNRILIVYVTRPQIVVLGWSTQAPPMAPRPQVQY